MATKILSSKYQGEIDFGGFKISCAVLEDGTRVLVNRSLANVFEIKGSGAYWQKKKEQKGALLPEYISSRYLQEFISEDLMIKLSESIPYYNIQGVLTEGLKAEYLSDICDIFKKAGEKGALKNADIGEKAYQIILALSKVAIIALVDEATGYQYNREKDELQKILRGYIAVELLPWQKRFPDIYYKELFRLNGWDLIISDIRKKPGVIGTWTNILIYDQLPKGVKEELMRKTPKSKTGNKLARYHQFLTLDIGEPNLTAQINQVITLFQLSDSMEHMWKQFKKLKLRQQGQLELPFNFDSKGHTIEFKIESESISSFNQSLSVTLKEPPK